MRTEDRPEIVGSADHDPDRLTRVAGVDPEDLLANVRRAVDSGLSVLIAPDDLAAGVEEWVALTAAAVIDGATAIETRHGREARRLLDMHHAIVTGGAELEQ